MLYDDVGGRKKVTHCRTDDEHTTLGVMLTPDDNNKSLKKDASDFKQIWG